jgi:hypothetical protein
VPPRRHAWKQRLLTLVVVLAIAAIARLVWGVIAQRKVDAVIADAKARGEPVLLDDFKPQRVPRENNAALPLSQAAASAWPLQNAELSRGGEATLPLDESTLEMLREIMPTHRRDLELVRSAIPMTQADWGTRLETRLTSYYVNTGRERNLSRFLEFAVLYDHLQGNDHDAISDVMGMLALADAEEQRAPMLNSHLAAQSISSAATAVARELCPTLALSAASASQPSAPADRAQVQALIARLLDEKPMRDGLRQAWLGHRMMLLEEPTQHAEEVLHYRTLARLLLPYFEMRAVRRAGELEMAMRADAEPIWDDAREDVSKVTAAEERPGRRFIRGGMDLYSMSLERPTSLLFRNIADRRMTAILFALRLYEIDHGKLPAALADLAPTYLQEIPVDPFRGDGGPIQYLPERDPPIIYSLGFNGTDELGSEKPMRSSGNLLGFGRAPPWQAEDAVYPIHPPPREVFESPDHLQGGRDGRRRRFGPPDGAPRFGPGGPPPRGNRQ